MESSSAIEIQKATEHFLLSRSKQQNSDKSGGPGNLEAITDRGQQGQWLVITCH